MMKTFLLSVLSYAIGILAAAQSGSGDSFKAVEAEISYTCDNVVNLHGGLKNGFGFLGMVNLRLGLDFEKAKLWKGGHLYANAVNTHGAMPSVDILGDAQVVSNIEAGAHTFFQELWFRQVLGRFELTIGLQDLNVEFAASEHGSIFLNSSFGVLPIISGNMTAPIFPLTSPGITLKWNMDESNTWLIAVYDGHPTGFDYNPYNVRWDYIAGDGILAISELQHSLEINTLPGTFKIGFFSYNHAIEDNIPVEYPDSLKNNVAGAYLYADQRIWQRAEKSVGVFLQAGYCPSKASEYNFYFGTGISISGLTGKAKPDVLGLALAHAEFTHHSGSETAIELTWKKQIHKHIFIQPDFQYIIHPSGFAGNPDNCLAGIFRVGISF